MPERRLDLESMLTDEKKLEEWHRPRIDHLKKTRLIRDLTPSASLLETKLFKDNPDISRIVSARPWLTWQWAVASLAGQPFKYRNPYSNASKTDTSSIPEYIAYGIDAQVDALLGRRGTREPRRYRMAKQVVSGSIAWRPLIRKAPNVAAKLRALDEEFSEKLDAAETQKREVARKDYEERRRAIEEGVIFDILFYDPATVYWLPGRMGLHTVIISVETTLLDAAIYVESQGGRLSSVTGKETDRVKTTECWTERGGKVYMGYAVQQTQGDKKDLALPFEEQPEETIPIICGSVNIPGDESAGHQQRMDVYGNSILAPLIRSVQQANTWESLALFAAGDHLFPTEVTKTRSGQGVDNAAKPGEQAKIDLAIDEEFQYVQKPSAALDVRQQSEWFRQELDQTGVSPSALGSTTPMPPSAILMESARFSDQVVKLKIFEDAFKDAEKQTMMWWLRELRDRNATVELNGRHLAKNGLDGYFQGEYKGADVPKGYWEIVVDHEPARPLDKLAQFNLASGMLQAGLISQRRAMEMADVEDPEGEEEKRQEERIKQSPLWEMTAQLNAVKQLWEDAKAELRKRVKDGASEPRIEAARRDAAAYEAMFFMMDRALAQQIVGPTIQGAQAQPGQEAPQPNASAAVPNPPSQVEPPEFRGEGREQQQMKMMAGASRNGGS